MKEYILAQNADVTTYSATEALVINDLKDYNISVVFSSGTISGTLKLQAKTALNSPYIDVLDSDQLVSGGANHMWNVKGANYPYVRVSWTYAGGAGNLTIYAVIKENPIIGA